MTEPRVLYRDDDLLCLVKPAGMPAQADPTGDPSLSDWASELVGRKLDPIHRLDRPVGGLTVFGLHPESVQDLSRQFAERTARKVYRGLCQGQLPAREGRLEHFLIKQNGRAHVRKGPPAKLAQLDYRVLEDGLVELEPRTGRFHQIRAQLAASGCPLLGDTRYGAKKPRKDRSIALWATRLELRHPRTGEPLTFEALPPW